MKTLTKADLDAATCAEPNCTHDHSILFIHSACHPRAGTRARYIKATSTLTFDCARCNKPIVAINLEPTLAQPAAAT